MNYRAVPPPDPRRVRNLYSGFDSIYAEEDKWNRVVYHEIRKHTQEFVYELDIPKNDYILNLGSAGDSLGLHWLSHVHLDLVEMNLFPPFSVCGNVQNIPFCDNSFSIIICVGSVINYCNAPHALSEISRVLRPGGYLVLEFDKSESFEFLFTGSWRKSASVVRTFYLDKEDIVWVYSEPFVEGLLEQNDIAIKKCVRVHILSPLIYKFTGSQNLSVIAARLDKVFKKSHICENTLPMPSSSAKNI